MGRNLTWLLIGMLNMYAILAFSNQAIYWIVVITAFMIAFSSRKFRQCLDSFF